MNNFIRKVLLFLGVAFVLLGVSAKPTLAYIYDNEVSEENTFGSTSLDMTLTSETSDFFPEEGLLPGVGVGRTVSVGNVGELPFYYRLEYEYVSGDSDFCNALTVNIDSGVTYSGPLTTNPHVIGPLFSASGSADFDYQITLPSDTDSSLANKSCQFNIKAYAWQEGGGVGSGFWDVEVLLNDISSGEWGGEPELVKIVVNEVCYDVDTPSQGDDGGGPTSDEWVELYNPNDFAVNLKDWTLSDNSVSRTISHSNKYIPAHGFAVIAKAAQTWTYWTIPGEAEKIELGDNIGNGLANDGDRVILRDNNGVEIDAVSWGDDITAFTPSVGDVVEGHSISRVVKGVDTDAAVDWMDTYGGSDPVGPNPGTNPHPPAVSSILFTPLFVSLDPFPSPTPEPLVLEAPPTPSPSPEPIPMPSPTPETLVLETPVPTPDLVSSPIPSPTPSLEPSPTSTPAVVDPIATPSLSPVPTPSPSPASEAVPDLPVVIVPEPTILPVNEES
ncbi:hypothetical protein A2382_00265 [Candidatus Woesebacteria bacterium RIFOXYB1_FULL_38_16]|uniref:LTD domain-containing protein n=1 Tax=Candidatus Woesebacteria bacterium RIFOXYB1_FULL_38_16 TaxID=1802538 RepID=A0A1F8CUG4_9BACT|nr:MAG: hypothetical protein A2191_01210 [Candidatus Woesebacteria bacterium RIFOXYA1_FULL_38_9]OGM79205.1 MAG: hypothetical protein A2382_00265 [Candidatus Woesebacteria bacterium RIFOXYB1_FULL_38_16]